MGETDAAALEPSFDDLSFDQRRMLEEVYQALTREGRWPSFDVVDHQADKHGIEDVLGVVQSLTPAYLQGLAPDAVPSLQQPIRLSLEGVAAVASWNDLARRDLEVFVATVKEAVKVSDRTEPPNAARFDALAYLSSLYPHGVELALLQRSHAIWSTSAGRLWHGISAPDGPGWSAVLNRQSLRAYRRVHDVESLLAVERQRRERQSRDSPPPVTSAQPSTGPSEVSSQAPGWVGLLPEEFKAALGSRLSQPGPDAITGGWIELADLIHRKTGEDLDGAALINKAFGKNATVHLVSQHTEAGRNLHEGYTDLLRGLARMRNVHAHRGGPKHVSDLHVASLLLAMGECYAQLARLPDAMNEGPARE